MIKGIYRKIVPSEIRHKISIIRNRKNEKQRLKSFHNYFTNNPSEYVFYEEEIKHIKKGGRLAVFPYKWANNYSARDYHVAYNQTLDLKYINHNGRELYFPRGMDELTVKHTYGALLVEQDKLSPHRYLPDGFKVLPGDVFVDVGSAEGLISLDLVEEVSHILLFESDERWLEALEATFAPWKNKVEIIRKYVSNKNNATNSRLDYHLSDFKGRLLIKIDVEGMEAEVLEGAYETLQRGAFFMTCTYHNVNDAFDFEQLFTNNGYKTEFTPGYMLWWHDANLQPPYFRKGIIRAQKI